MARYFAGAEKTLWRLARVEFELRTRALRCIDACAAVVFGFASRAQVSNLVFRKVEIDIMFLLICYVGKAASTTQIKLFFSEKKISDRISQLHHLCRHCTRQVAKLDFDQRRFFFRGEKKNFA